MSAFNSRLDLNLQEYIMLKTILIAVLLLFGAQSIYVMSQVGYWGIWVNNWTHPAGQQVFTDLIISLSLVMLWLWRDAQRNQRSVWPWLLVTLAAGSFGPLLYLLTAKKSKEAW